MKKTGIARVAFVLVAGLMAPATHAAVVASIDRFTVTVNGAAFFDDPFGDGVAPPNAPAFANGDPTSYFTQGTFAPGSESSGRLAFDTAGFVPTANVLGNPSTFATATLLSSNNPANPLSGLRTGTTFNVRGLFDYIVPTGSTFATSTSYGIRLTDGGGDDVLDLRVIVGDAGLPLIYFRRQNFIAGTLTVLGEVLLPASGFDQVALSLTRGSLLNNDIAASFQLLSGGAPIGVATTLAAMPAIFNGENWTRADFRATAPIPEASTWALMALGLIVLSWRLSASARRPS